MSRVPNLEVKSANRRAAEGLVLGLVVAMLVGALRFTPLIARGEVALEDTRTLAFLGDREADDRIAVMIVDDAAIAYAAREYGITSWPWPQNVQGAIVDLLHFSEARGVVLDFLFLDRGKDPSEVSDYERHKGEIDGQLEMARALGSSLSRFGPAVAGVVLTNRAEWQTPQRIERAEPRLMELGESADTPVDASMAELPVMAVMEGVRRLGFVNVVGGPDGVYRRYFPAARWGDADRAVPSLALAAASLDPEHEVHIAPDAVRVGGAVQRLDAQGGFHLNFRAALDADPYERIDAGEMLAAADLLAYYPDRKVEGASPEEQAQIDEAYAIIDKAAARVRGKLVIWGASYQAGRDVKASPLGTYLGPLLHATAIDNLWHGDGRVRVAPWINWALLLLICGLLGAYSGRTRKRILPHILMAGAAALVFGMAFLLFSEGHIIDLFSPLLAIFLVWVASSVYRLLTEGRRNRWLESTFSRYLSAEVIDALKGDPSRLQLGGRRRELSVFFSDVAGFTSMSQKLEAEQVVHLLNRYLTGQSEELMQENGVIDKFEGDAIMAFFGDPLEMNDHAVRACRSALRCIRALDDLVPTWKDLNLEHFDIRIGINSGIALVGNMGSERRFDYTCMGDTVNLASRLEGANKAFGSRVMIGPRTYEQAKDEILAKPIADLVVVGRDEGVAVYELVAMQNEASAAQQAHVEAFRRAHEAARQGALAEAREALAEAERHMPGDGLCRWFGQLLDDLAAGTLESPWSGLVRLTEK